MYRQVFSAVFIDHSYLHKKNHGSNEKSVEFHGFLQNISSMVLAVLFLPIFRKASATFLQDKF